ncbi:MAG: hypothetical protein EB072_04055 [Betaproteobacteria bacterium]|nr:hypothetical protein [Betaproteobacteria bacterium]
MTRKPTAPIEPVRTQLLAAWDSAAEAQLIREFKARLRLDGLTYKDWLTGHITDYLTTAKKPARTKKEQ